MSRTRGEIEENRRKRQAILDYLNARGPDVAARICNVVGGMPKQVAARLRMMEGFKEVEKCQQGYRALVDKTADTFTIPTRQREAMRQGQRGIEPKRDVPKSKGTWHTVHLCSDKEPPAPGSGGGQGAIRLTHGVASSADILF